MSFLLDTNIVSQPTKPVPDVGVIRWLNQTDPTQLYLTVITVQEIRTGVELLPAGKRQRALDEWLSNDLPARFSGRILPVDELIADRCGHIVAATRKRGHTPELADVLIAATAVVHGLTLVTMNRKHFEMFPVTILTP